MYDILAIIISMKKLIGLILLTLSLSTLANDQLIKELEKKEANFSSVKSMYESLKQYAKKEDKVSFCNLIAQSQTTLEDIYQDDYSLNQELIKYGTDFSIDYSKKIYENSASDIFAINNYKDSCDENRIMPLGKFILDLNRSLDNNHILNLSHKLFMQIFQGLNSL
jgi:hypothetical protein